MVIFDIFFSVSFGEEIVILSNKIYWNANPLITQDNTDLEIKFFNSSETEKNCIWQYDIHTVQLY